MEGMSSGSWGTVWEIAGKRYQTKQGENFMTDHAFAVLQSLTMREQQQAMKDALGTYFHGIRTS